MIRMCVQGRVTADTFKEADQKIRNKYGPRCVLVRLKIWQVGLKAYEYYGYYVNVV